MATYPIRPVAEDELAGFLTVDQHASHGRPMSGRAHANFLARLEFGRTDRMASNRHRRRLASPAGR